jgi:hypothetical protein
MVVIVCALLPLQVCYQYDFNTVGLALDTHKSSLNKNNNGKMRRRRRREKMNQLFLPMLL